MDVLPNLDLPNCPTSENSQCPAQSYAANRRAHPCMLTLVLATQEANYGHQQELDMIPLMMQKNYAPKGWLGLIMGTRMW
jgi:hypothetical protein